MKNSVHIAETDFALYAMGALSADEMAQTRAHLAGCARCKEELSQTDAGAGCLCADHG